MEEINKALELKKYRVSEEFEELLKKYSNKAENIREKVLTQLKSGGFSKEMIAGEDDKLIIISEVLVELAQDIKSELEGAKIFKENLLRNIENIDFNLVRQIKGFAEPIYTEKCKLLVRAGEYDFLGQRMDGLIAMFEKTKEKESEDLYETIEDQE